MIARKHLRLGGTSSLLNYLYVTSGIAIYRFDRLEPRLSLESTVAKGVSNGTLQS